MRQLASIDYLLLSNSQSLAASYFSILKANCYKSGLAIPLLFNDLYYLVNQLLKLDLGDPTVSVGVNRSHQIVNVSKGGLLDIECHGYAPNQLSELVLFQVA